MLPPASASATPWRPAGIEQIRSLLADSPVRWWLSGGVALDRWLGRSIRDRANVDVSVIAADLPAFVAALPPGFSMWGPGDEEGGLVVPLDEVDADIDPQPILVRDDARGVWVLQVNVEDGAPGAWVYKRDSRLALPWDRAVIDIDGIPTGAPEVQLVWKSLRPRPEDDVDKDAVVGALTEDARAWYERAILSIHPHSSWSIQVRSPFAPAKASWNRRPKT